MLQIVIFPQAMRLAAPPFVNLCVNLIKATSLVSIVGLWELTMASREVVERTLAPFQIFSPRRRSISASATRWPCMENTLNDASSLATEPAVRAPMLAMSGIVQALRRERGAARRLADRGARRDVVVIGPSGSGKTTLLRCINMLEDYQEGTVTVDGEPVGYTLDRYRPAAADVGA